MGLQQFDERVAQSAGVTVVNAGVGANHQFSNNNVTPYRWDYVFVKNTDSIDHTVTLGYYQAGSTNDIGTFNVPAGTGSPPVANMELLALLLPSGQFGLSFDTQSALSVRVNEAILGGSDLEFTAVGATV